ncbi:Clp protease N-terminal domain-containing protein [Kutzneria sp. NPDC051319]|uniref:Clp protease N-terminal domain-containing protein n=1 Tax=Kutzneria sp. NPDC051319 TaxID=3155047 RepID=UPI00343024BD
MLAVARREARAQVSSGHLLLGALHPEGGRVELDVDLDEMRDHVRVLTAGPSDPHTRLSERVKRVLIEHRTTRDVLLALLDDPGSTAARALVRAGQDLADLRARVAAMPGGKRKTTKVARELKYRQPPGRQPG